MIKKIIVNAGYFLVLGMAMAITKVVEVIERHGKHVGR